MALPVDTDHARIRQARRIPLYRKAHRLLRDPMKEFVEAGLQAGGDIVQLDLGVFRPYLLSHPEHVHHVLRGNAANYPRIGMFWRPLNNLVGYGIGGEGEYWEYIRGMLQPVFAGKNLAAITDDMAATIVERVDELQQKVSAGRPVDAELEMTRIVQHAVTRFFIGDRVSADVADRLGDAITSATGSLASRIIFSFVPSRVPMPGDGTFKRAVRVIDEIVFPVIREARRTHAPGYDVLSLLLRARDADGRALDDQQLRDEIVGLYVAGGESSAVALIWLWVALDANPEVAAKLYEEIDRVVGTDLPRRSHLSELRYAKMFLQELLRMYSVGWMVPRQAVSDDVIDGVRVKAGATVLISPYITHQLDSVWERPHVFDPERFAPDRQDRRQARSYLAYGAGPHQCVGRHLFVVEAQLVLAAILTRFRPELRTASPVEPRIGLALKPRQAVEIVLRPVEHA
ncbi:cytochrome P450 [Nonomuraea lactucae]|uniref:cytochrome P450 n=1 Tax=Nonomuraea lactucae TaxID=2249762 RepID=UPI000DE41D2C|nr:cytochrome P450 [Nonomuraea lactucae]